MKNKTFILSLLATIIMTSNVCAEIVTGSPTNGNGCGTNCSWSINTKTGELIISGTGDMDDFSAYGATAPWRQNQASVHSVVITEGITSIGENAFFMMPAETKIIIADSVESIGNAAFTGISLPTIVCSEAKKSLCEEATTRSYSSVSYDEDGNVIRSALSPIFAYYEKTSDGYYKLNNDLYSSLKNMQKNKTVKRIYTIQEANEVSGKINTVKLRYK